MNGFTYGITAIPTTYNGINFRSRLEARWAAFFNFCGWSWEYESRPLGEWIPDFVLKTQLGELFVEVKPAVSSVLEKELERLMRLYSIERGILLKEPTWDKGIGCAQLGDVTVIKDGKRHFSSSWLGECSFCDQRISLFLFSEENFRCSSCGCHRTDGVPCSSSVAEDVELFWKSAASKVIP